MKTLIVYEEVPESVKFFLADGDRSALNECFVNSTDSKKFAPEVRQEVGDGARNEHWTEVKLPLRFDLQEQEIIVVHCGFFL